MSEFVDGLREGDPIAWGMASAVFCLLINMILWRWRIFHISPVLSEIDHNWREIDINLDAAIGNYVAMMASFTIMGLAWLIRWLRKLKG